MRAGTMNIALILAGGRGSRLGCDTPKQYVEAAGKPLIAYCLKVFEEHVSVDAIQIVAEENWHFFIEAWAGDKLKGFSKPGYNMQLSILNGLKDILKYAEESDIVIIHDAARPMVSAGLVSACIQACHFHDGCIPVLPVRDTVYMGDGKRITALLDRESVCAGQAPEAFRLGMYYRANLRLLPDEILKINGSTEPAILAGMDVALIEGEEKNFKITTAAELERFKRFLEEQKLESIRIEKHRRI